MIGSTNVSLQNMPSAIDLLRQRDHAIRESWMIQTGKIKGQDTDDYEKAVSTLLELWRLKNLRKNAMALLEGKWIHVGDVYRSINSLPSTIEKEDGTLILDKNIIFQHLSPKKSLEKSAFATNTDVLSMAA